MQLTELESALGQLRESRASLEGPRKARSTACLTFTDARLLVLNPAAANAAQRAHTESCRLCAALMASLQEEMPHLSIALLVRRVLGLLSVAEEELVSYHLTRGQCSLCERREATVQAFGAPFVALRGPWRLPTLSAVGAAGEDLTIAGASGGLEAELVIGTGTAALEIRTRDPEVARQPVVYELRGEHGTQAGVVRLQPDVQQWFTALIPCDAAASRSLGGGVSGVTVASVPLDVLTRAERLQLSAGA